MRLLAVSFVTPPLLTARSLQVARTLKHLTALGWDCTALSVDPVSLREQGLLADPALERLYRGTFRIVRTRTPENTRLLRWLRRFLVKLNPPGARAVWGGKVLWVPSAIRAGRSLLVEGGAFSVIVSFAMPWASHVVGRALARASGLPWAAHFSDPWADSPYFHGGACARRLLNRIEARTISDADLAVFVTERTADLVMRKYPLAWRRKIRVIPHGYDVDLLPRRATHRAGAPLRLVHTGGLYDLRTPGPLLRALELLSRTRPLRDRLEVVLIGSLEPTHARLAERLGLGQIARCVGPSPYLETLRAAAEADVCLLIDAPADAESVFLPAKIVDYLMLRRPILGLTPLHGESADLLRRVGCPVVAPDDVPGIAAAIGGLLQAWETNGNALRLSPDYDRVASEYDVRDTTRRLDAALRAVRQGGARAGRR